MASCKGQNGPLRFDIGGMHCAACSTRIERVLGRMEGVERVSVNLPTARAQVWPAPFVPGASQAPASSESPAAPAAPSQAEIQGQIQTLGHSITERVATLGFTAVLTEDEDPAALYAKNQALAQAERQERLGRLVPMLGLALPLLYISMGHMLGLPLPHALHPEAAPRTFMLAQLLLTLPVLWLGRHFYLEGLPALWRRAPNMDSLVAVGTGAAFLYSLGATVAGLAGQQPAMRAMQLYYESAAVLLSMIELGKYLEFSARRKAGDAMGALMRLTPDTALRLSADDPAAPPAEVPVAALRPGDTLLIRPGARVPVDGRILSGRSAVDLSLLTGESIPVPVEPGQSVVAGSVNGEGSLTLLAEEVGQDTRLARIIRLVREAQGSKAPIARLADQVSYYFVPAVMLFALLAALAWLLLSTEPLSTPLSVFVAVLVMACPCAMGLATPMSIMVGTGRGAQLGVLIKNGAALEQAGRITALAVDKTGTLTTGKPALTAVEVVDTWGDASALEQKPDEHLLLTLAAALEARSEHPLARALTQAGQEQGCAPCAVEDVETVPGLGIAGRVRHGATDYAVAVGSAAFMARRGLAVPPAVEARLAELAEAGQTPLLLALGKGEAARAAGILAVADALRPESAAVVARLRGMGVRVLMLTGDNERTARAVARLAGVDEVRAGLLPQDKAQCVRDLQAEGFVVGMVGDGVNDAPALALAHVGMAVGTGVDVSAEAGDLVLMRGGMGAVLTALALSRATMRNIRQNLFWAFAYNVLGLPVAAGLLHAFGGPMLSPMLAGTAMALSSVSVVSNALRLRWFRPV